MSTQSSTFDPSQFAQVFRDEVLAKVPASADYAEIMLENTALTSLTHACLKNAPYTFLGSELDIADVFHVLSTRVTFIESLVVAIAGAVHHLFFSLLYTGLVICTIGFSTHINYCCRKHWTHLVYGLGSGVISLVGFVKPYYGIGLSLWLGLRIFKNIKKNYNRDLDDFEESLLRGVKEITTKFSPHARDYFRAKHPGDFGRIYEPTLRAAEKRILDAKRMEDITKLVLDCFYKWPNIG